jgi:lactate dehydrogenase-like 2-hydroxyacid dehydrogenase
MQRHLAPLSAFLEGAYDVDRFWEGPPIEAAGDIRALIVAGEFELDKDLIERLPNLSLVACFTAGYDGIDVEWCRARGRPVTQAPGVNHEDVADHAIGLILASRRQIAEGDRAVRGPDTPCACGSSFPRIARILGRADDVLVTPEGHHVGRLDPIFKAVSSLDETRIVQDEREHVRVEMVSSAALSPADTAILHEGLRNRLGPTMRIDFVRVDGIQRTAGGKLRSVVNLTAAKSGSRQSTPTAG